MKKYLILKLKSESFNIKIEHGFDSIEEMEKELKPQNEWKPKKDERIYFIKGCTVPRRTLKEVVKDENFFITTKIQNADTIIIPKVLKSKDEDILEKKLLKVNSNSVINWISELHAHYGLPEFLKIKYVSLLKNFTEVYLDTIYIYLIKGNGHNMHPINAHLKIKTWDSLIKMECTKILLSNELIKKEFSYVKETGIIKKLSENNQILDENFYNSLRNMAKSQDKSDLTIALEIMANCNYSKSVVYLLLLIIEFKNEILSHKSRNSSNFKNLLKYLNIDNLNNLRLSPDFILESLKRSKAYTEKNLKRVTDFYIEHGGISFRSKHFQNSIIPMSEDAKTFDNEYECFEDDEILNIDEE